MWYVGYVRVLAHQALQQAVDWQKGERLQALKWCLRDVGPSTVQAVPLQGEKKEGANFGKSGKLVFPLLLVGFAIITPW